MQKVLIAGATGMAGQSLTKYFNQEKDIDVYGITSNSENTMKLETMGAEPIVADLTNEDQTLKAIENIQPDVVLSSVMGRGEHASRQERRMGENLIHASLQNEVDVLGYISVYCADQKTGVPHFDVKEEIEALIRQSGINYLIIRPATFMDGLFLPWFLQPVKDKNTIVSPNNPEVKISYIHTQDIADIIGYALQHELLNKTYTVGGEPLSVADLQKIFTDKKGAKTGYHRLSLEQVEQTVGTDIALMVKYFNQKGFEVTENILPKGYQSRFKRFEEEIDQYL